MSLPCIKFISYMTSYMTFVGLIIGSTFANQNVDTHAMLFSTVYAEYAENFTAYAENHKLAYRFEEHDFYLRPHMPSVFDYLICIFLLGMPLRLPPFQKRQGVSFY